MVFPVLMTKHMSRKRDAGAEQRFADKLEEPTL